MPLIRFCFLLATLALAAAATPAGAAAGAHCSIATTPLAFGHYVPSRHAPTDFTATLTLTCTATGAEPAAVDGTISLLGSAGGRRLSDGTNQLRYQTFSDPARTLAWTDGAGAKTVSGLVAPGTPLRASFTIYGRLLARQPQAQVGHYTDRITAILNY